MISVYYVYIDGSNEWFTGESAPSSDWQDAKEIFEETKAARIAEVVGGVVFGWVQ